MVALAENQDSASAGRLRRRMKVVTPEEVLAATARNHHVDAGEYIGFRSSAAGREMAVLLCRRYTGVPLRSLSELFGLGRPDSASNLVRQLRRREEESSEFRNTIAEIEQLLKLNTENRV
jgi:chromosomal replication initiation ATPase DnaA